MNPARGRGEWSPWNCTPTSEPPASADHAARRSRRGGVVSPPPDQTRMTRLFMHTTTHVVVGPEPASFSPSPPVHSPSACRGWRRRRRRLRSPCPPPSRSPGRRAPCRPGEGRSRSRPPTSPPSTAPGRPWSSGTGAGRSMPSTSPTARRCRAGPPTTGTSPLTPRRRCRARALRSTPCTSAPATRPSPAWAGTRATAAGGRAGVGHRRGRPGQRPGARRRGAGFR